MISSRHLGRDVADLVLVRQHRNRVPEVAVVTLRPQRHCDGRTQSPEALDIREASDHRHALEQSIGHRQRF